MMERHNGVFGGCWCTYFQTMAAEKTYDADDNRSLKQRLVEEGRAHAALVLDGDEAVAWAQYGSPEELPNIYHRKEYDEAGDPAPDYRVTCIFVDKRHRRKGSPSSPCAARSTSSGRRAAVSSRATRTTPATGGRCRCSTTAPGRSTSASGSTYVRPKGLRNCVMRTTSPAEPSEAQTLRLLLGDAVDAAAPGEQRAGVDADDPAAGVGPLEHGERVGVLRVVEGAGHHAAVDDEVVDVAPVDRALVVLEGLGRGHPDDLERLAAGVARRRQQPLELDRHLVVGVAGVALPVQQHDARATRTSRRCRRARACRTRRSRGSARAAARCRSSRRWCAPSRPRRRPAPARGCGPGRAARSR